MKYSYIAVLVILIAAVFAAGCDEEVSPPAATETMDVTLPGQTMVCFGDVTGDGIPRGTIDTITFTTGLAPGAKSINIENISIVYADAIRTETLIPVVGYRGDPPDGAWGILQIEKEVGNPNNRLEDQERLVIRINPKAPLVPRQMITIIVKSPTGTPLTIRRISPPTIMANNILHPL